MSDNSWIIVSNRFSGRGRAGVRSSSLKEKLQARGHFATEVNGSTLEGCLVDLRANLVINSPRGILIVGGDGLVNAVVSEVHKVAVDTPILVVAEGTGNDFSRTCGTFGLSDDDLVDLICKRDPHRLDLLLINERPCVEIAATGFDANVNRRANAMRRVKGKLKYVVAMLQELIRLKAISYRLILDGNERTFEALFVAVANSASYGGGMRISPNSSPHDGLIEVAVLEPVTRLELLRVFPRVFSGTHINHPSFKVYRGVEGRLEAETSVYADGEDFGTLPIDFRVFPNAIKVWKSP